MLRRSRAEFENVRLQQPLATRVARVMLMMQDVDQLCHRARKVEIVVESTNPVDVGFIILP